MDLGIIGVGGIARRHLDNLAAIDRADVVAVCDVDEDRADSVAADRDATAYYDHERLYADADLDAVLVAIPPFAHTDQETLAAERGLGVFVEKPVALSTDEARRIGGAIEQAGVVNQVGYALRYAESVERARELIDPADVAVIEGRYTYPGPPDSAWWRRRERSGGQVVEQSTHVYDTVRHLVGDVDRVVAAGRQRHVDAIDFADATMATLEHGTGVLSHVTSTCAASSKAMSLRITGPTLDLLLDPIDDELTGTAAGEEIDFAGDSDPFAAELEAFVEAVETGSGEPVRCDYADAAETLATTLAVNESIETDRAVAVDSDPAAH